MQFVEKSGSDSPDNEVCTRSDRGTRSSGRGVPINMPIFEMINRVLRPRRSTRNAPVMAAMRFHTCRPPLIAALVFVCVNPIPDGNKHPTPEGIVWVGLTVQNQVNIVRYKPVSAEQRKSEHHLMEHKSDLPPLGENGKGDDKAHTFPVPGRREQYAPGVAMRGFLFQLQRMSDLCHFKHDERVPIVAVTGMKVCEYLGSF